MINTSTFIVKTCQPASDAKTCRYLTMDHKGWECARGSGALEAFIDQRAEQGLMTAVGVNCSGRKL